MFSNINTFGMFLVVFSHYMGWQKKEKKSFGLYNIIQQVLTHLIDTFTENSRGRGLPTLGVKIHVLRLRRASAIHGLSTGWTSL